jgi:hypothetical protein
MTTKVLEQLQLDENKAQLLTLKNLGDDSTLSRNIVHKLEFISEYKKRDLVNELEEQSFKICEEFVTEEGYNGMMFHKDDKTDAKSIETLTLLLIKLLDEHDARYGGWTTVVLKEI